MNKTNCKTQELWYLMLKEQDGQHCRTGEFYAHGEHLGDALKNALEEARQHQFSDPDLVAAGLINVEYISDGSDATAGLSISMRLLPRIGSFKPANTETAFIPPTGVVRIPVECKQDYNLLKESFAEFGRQESGIFQWMLQVSKRNFLKTFFHFIDLLPSIDDFLVFIDDCWENAGYETWEATDMKDKASLVKFLLSNQPDTIENGYIQMVIHSSTGKTNMVLDNYKMLILYTTDEGIAGLFTREALGLGFEQVQPEKFLCLASGFNTYGYRPAGSLSRKGFMEMLNYYKFKLSDAVLINEEDDG